MTETVLLRTDIVYSTKKLSPADAAEYFKAFQSMEDKFDFLDHDVEGQKIIFKNDEPEFNNYMLGVYVTTQMKNFLNPDTDMEFKSIKFAYNPDRTILTVTIRANLLNKDRLIGQS